MPGMVNVIVFVIGPLPLYARLSVWGYALPPPAVAVVSLILRLAESAKTP